MKTESLIPASWNDLVFENRNKEYGAYYVRQSYSKNMIMAFGISITFAALLIVSPEILKGLRGKEMAVAAKTDLKEEVTILVAPPVIPTPPIAPPPPSAPAVHTPVTNLPPQVTVEDVDTVLPDNTEIAASMGDGETGTVTEVSGTSVGIVEAPPVVEKGPVSFAEVMPSFDGGMEAMIKYLRKNLKYPHSASQMGIEGSVFVSFVVDRNGQITDVQIVKGVSADCDKEALRVVSRMPAWKAGMQNHQPVAVKMVLPIVYRLN